MPPTDTGRSVPPSHLLHIAHINPLERPCHAMEATQGAEDQLGAHCSSSGPGQTAPVSSSFFEEVLPNEGLAGADSEGELQCYNSASADPTQHTLPHFHQDLVEMLENEREHQDHQIRQTEADRQLGLLTIDDEQRAPGAPSEWSGLFGSITTDLLLKALPAKAEKGPELSDPEIQPTPRQLNKGPGSRLSRMTSWVDMEMVTSTSALRLSQANLSANDFEGGSPRASLPLLPRLCGVEGCLLRNVASSTFSDFGDVPATNLQRPRRFEVAGEDSSGYLFKDDAERYAQLRAMRQEDRFASYYDSETGSEAGSAAAEAK